mmetsp:Transcript_19266/g.41942  ORF Transcript_19266/g.41942 Transcript_19266/m.41942 type:complete len:155 (-) Transcript_19266:828-1292(-)
MFQRCRDNKSKSGDVESRGENLNQNVSQEENDRLVKAVCMVEEVERAAQEAGIGSRNMHKQLGLRASKNVLKIAIFIRFRAARQFVYLLLRSSNPDELVFQLLRGLGIVAQLEQDILLLSPKVSKCIGSNAVYMLQIFGIMRNPLDKALESRER